MKESITSPYSKLVFRETFRDESSVRMNGGTPTNVTFENGKGVFNGSSSKINYNLGLNGTYSVRVRCNPTSFAAVRYLLDLRSSTSDGVGIIYLSVTTGTFATSSGTRYVNGVASSTSIAGQDTEFVVTGINFLEGTGLNQFILGANQVGAQSFLGTIDLFEIYQGTLTASEVKNLYENKWNKEVSGYGGQLSPNLIKNNQFENWTGGTPDEWSLSGTVSATNYLEQASNGLRIISDGALLGVSQAVLTIGKPYKVIIDVEINSGSSYIRVGDTATNQYTLTEGVNTISVDSVDNTLIAIRRQTACDILIKSIIVQEIQPDLLLDFDSTQGTIKDRTGKRTLTPTDVTIKKIGQSYSADFNGTTSLIDTGTDFIGTKVVTIMGWIYLSGFGESGYGKILTNNMTELTLISSYSGWVNNIGFVSGGGAATSASANNSILLNKLQFVAVTRTSAGVANFYIGDTKTAPALSGSANQNSGTPAAGTSNVIIGNNSGATRTFDGNISELKVVEGILDLAQITQIWSSTRKNYI